MPFPVACCPKSNTRGAAFVGDLDAYTADLSLALLPFRGFASYEGALWRVRDDGDGDAEQDVIVDALGEPVFPTLVGNGGIRWWYDQSGQANDLPQATAASQPYLVDAIINGYPVARFDGTDDEMTLAMSGGNARTVYVVCKMRAATVNARAFKDCTTGANADVYYDSGTGKFYYYATAPNVVDPVGGTGTNWSLVCLKYSGGSTCQPYVNNSTAEAAFGTASYVGGGVLGFILGSAGGGNFGAVDIAARLVYDATHDDTTRESIQTILADKFGITLS